MQAVTNSAKKPLENRQRFLMFDDPTTAAQNDATVKLTYRIRY
jgi:hypothetical protein